MNWWLAKCSIFKVTNWLFLASFKPCKDDTNNISKRSICSSSRNLPTSQRWNERKKRTSIFQLESNKRLIRLFQTLKALVTVPVRTIVVIPLIRINKRRDYYLRFIAGKRLSLVAYPHCKCMMISSSSYFHQISRDRGNNLTEQLT